LTGDIVWEDRLNQVENGNKKEHKHYKWVYPCETILGDGTVFTITATETTGWLPWERKKVTAWQVKAFNEEPI